MPLLPVLLDELLAGGEQRARAAVEIADTCTMKAAAAYALSTSDPAGAIAEVAILKCSGLWARAGITVAEERLARDEQGVAMQTRVLVDQERSKIIVRVFDIRAARQ